MSVTLYDIILNYIFGSELPGCLPSYAMDITHWINFLYTTALYRKSDTVEIMLGTFLSERLFKIYEKIKMVLYHVIKRISHGLWLDMIFIQFVVCFLSPCIPIFSH